MIRDPPHEWHWRFVPFSMVAQLAGVDVDAVSIAVGRGALSQAVITVRAIGSAARTHLAITSVCHGLQPPQPRRDQLHRLGDPVPVRDRPSSDNGARGRPSRRCVHYDCLKNAPTLHLRRIPLPASALALPPSERPSNDDDEPPPPPEGPPPLSHREPLQGLATQPNQPNQPHATKKRRRDDAIRASKEADRARIQQLRNQLRDQLLVKNRELAVRGFMLLHSSFFSGTAEANQRA